MYAFSTENGKRPVEEVATIMDLLHKYLLEVLEKMERDGFRVHFFGNLEPLPPALRDLCLRAEETAASLSGKRHQVNICLNYGGRDEILRAAQAWGRDLLAGRQTVEDLTDEAFSRYLDSRGMPDPDLISQLTRSFILPMCSGPILPPRSWTRPWRRFSGASAGLEAYNREKSYFGGLCGCACDPSGPVRPAGGLYPCPHRRAVGDWDL